MSQRDLVLHLSKTINTSAVIPSSEQKSTPEQYGDDMDASPHQKLAALVKKTPVMWKIMDAEYTRMILL